MRRMLRILFWLGLGLSAILFVGTGVLWVRSLGHMEEWRFERIGPTPPPKTGPPEGWGIQRRTSIAAIHGKLWLTSSIWVNRYCFDARTEHRRDPITADHAQQSFDSAFTPGHGPWRGDIVRGWRFAGAGFREKFDAPDPESGKRRFEVYALAIPFWMLAAVFGLWPVCFAARRVLRRRRYGPGLCPSCGYDLRATPDRCPECGRVMSKA